MDDITIPLESENFYHVFNRGNDRQDIFFHDENYRFFLKRYGTYLSNYVDTFAYCLLPNHFHLMIRVKPKDDLLRSLQKDFNVFPKHLLKKVGVAETDLANFQNLASIVSYSKLEEYQQALILQWVVSERIRRCMMNYAKAINIQENRTGSLFQKVFRRKRIENEVYFTRLLGYIHRNPIHHDIVEDYKDYLWSSFHSFLSNQPTKIARAEVLNWFGGKQAFLDFHERRRIDYTKASFGIE